MTMCNVRGITRNESLTWVSDDNDRECGRHEPIKAGPKNRPGKKQRGINSWCLFYNVNAS